MLIREIMNRRAAAIRNDSTLQLAAELLVLTQAADLAVVDEDNNFVGILSEGDLIRAAMPDFEEVLAAGASHEDTYQMLVDSGRSLAGECLSRLVISNPFTLSPDDPVMKAASMMVSKMIRRLPVVEDGKFVGSVSRADLCWGLMCLGHGRVR